jgi:hypothetical protein
MKSTLFLSNLSIVDHAYINHNGQIIGGSYNPSFLVTGKVDDIENVVVDFSTIKKDLKKHIDKHGFDINNNGFDHKLWVIENYSDCSVICEGDRVVITTPAFYGSFPSDAIRYISNPDSLDFTDDFIGDQFAQHLTDCLAPEYPGVEIEVKCINSVDEHIVDKDMPISFFRYSHGLKDSTSYGCQNLGHGHLSFLQVEDQDACEIIASELHDAVFINKTNITYQDDERISISYTSQRGFFFGTYIKALNKIIILNTETTIEHIAEYVASEYGISDFYISEGLSKGTYVEPRSISHLFE